MIVVDRRWPDSYLKRERVDEANWPWLQLWQQENPHPMNEGDEEDFKAWYEEYRKMSARVWVAWCLPQFNVMDWSWEDVERAYYLVRRHVCSVCGREDDPGCVRGC